MSPLSMNNWKIGGGKNLDEKAGTLSSLHTTESGMELGLARLQKSIHRLSYTSYPPNAYKNNDFHNSTTTQSIVNQCLCVM